MYDGAVDAVNLGKSYVDGTKEYKFIFSSYLSLNSVK